MSTLRYAARAKSIKNKPKVNEDPKDALLKQYEDEIKKLKAMLEAMNKGEAPRQTQQNMAESLQRIQTNNNIMMDVGRSNEKEETVEELIKKL